MCGEFLMLVDTSHNPCLLSGDTRTFTHSHPHKNIRTPFLSSDGSSSRYGGSAATAVPAAARSGGSDVRGRVRLRGRMQQRRGEAGERSGGGSDR